MTRKILVIFGLATAAGVYFQAFGQSASAQRSEKETTTPKVAPSSSQSAFPSGPVLPRNEAKPSKETSKKSGPSLTPVSSAPLDSKADRKELVIEQAMVTLMFDNKVPASENGMLLDVPVEEGQSVEKDELLAQIDSRSTEARQRIAAAEMAAAEAEANNDANVEVAEKAVEVTKAELDQSLEIRRKNPGAVPETQVRKDRFNWEKSLAQVKQAKNEKEIAALTANAKKAQYDAASIELDLRQARAPFKGQVVEVMKKAGDWVTAGEPIMHIVGLDEVRVKGVVLMSGREGASQDEVLGRDVMITVYTAGDKTHKVKGKIGFASPVIEGLGSSRHFRIWADVENEKSIDPVTGQQVWKIQPGSKATMVIDMTSRPVATSRVQAYRPVSAEAKADKAKDGGPQER
jgi:multidrug efflux pump subunit AcrA (membrane-fusion protein)